MSRHMCPENETEDCDMCAASERRRLGVVVTPEDSRILQRGECRIIPDVTVPYEATDADVCWLREQAELAGAQVALVGRVHSEVQRREAST